MSEDYEPHVVYGGPCDGRPILVAPGVPRVDLIPPQPLPEPAHLGNVSEVSTVEAEGYTRRSFRHVNWQAPRVVYAHISLSDSEVASQLWPELE